MSVLVEFVNEDLGVEELKLIELMIKPQKGVRLSDPWKNREFLCEVRYAQYYYCRNSIKIWHSYTGR